MRIRLFHFPLITLFALFVGCAAPGFTSADEEAIRSVMDEQVLAWNQGDIPGFMLAYADSTCFISAQERTCGRTVVEARYERRYPDRQTMGQLDFSGLEVLGAGEDHAWCTGAWQLVRSQDTLSGGFSLFWERTPHGWEILRDHTY